MIDDKLMRIIGIENDLKDIKQAVGQAFVQIQATNRMLSDIFNYLVVKSVLSHNGNRDAVIEEMKLLNRSVSDADFNKMVIPLIDANIKVYNEEIAKKEKKEE